MQPHSSCRQRPKLSKFDSNNRSEWNICVLIKIINNMWYCDYQNITTYKYIPINQILCEQCWERSMLNALTPVYYMICIRLENVKALITQVWNYTTCKWTLLEINNHTCTPKRALNFTTPFLNHIWIRPHLTSIHLSLSWYSLHRETSTHLSHHHFKPEIPILHIIQSNYPSHTLYWCNDILLTASDQSRKEKF